ncbi:MAG: PDZ domain-containing protein, partial [Gemmatimonadaceae bacterium]|nr:PDZ domain-containing protein [Gloeobacterales cyanobacterium ES-bin-141]
VQQGALVAQVTPGGAAAKAGLRGGNREVTLGNLRVAIGGDVIVGVDGKEVLSGQALIAELEKHRPGERVTLDVVRGDQRTQIPVTLGKSTGKE